MLHPILQPVLQPVLRSPFDRRPAALTTSQLLPSGAGRVAAIYSDPAKPSYDECIQKNMEAMGPELVVNGGFDSTDGWTGLPAVANISGGTLNITSYITGGSVLATNSAVFAVGRTYVVSYTVSGLTGSVSSGGGLLGAIRTTSGAYTEILVATGATLQIVARGSGCSAANIDNISVREIDLSKCVLFADAAGQTPVVYPIGAGQGKGLLLDRSAGLVRGPELVVNGGFDTDTGWTKGTGWNITAGVATKSAGTQSDLSRWVFVDNAPGRSAWKTFEVSLSAQVTAGGFTVSVGGYTFSPIETTGGDKRYFLTSVHPDSNGTFYVRGNAAFVGTIDNISVRELPGHHQQQPTAAARGEFSRRYNQLLATDTLATQSITAIAAQYRLYFTGAGTVTLSGAATGAYSAGSHTITCTAGSLTLTVAGSVLTADLRFEADATIGLPEYQDVVTASDYDETGFPTYWRAVTDDWAKSHMNPNGATKAYVFWAGQKMSDAASSIVLEHSASADENDGAMHIAAPSGAGADRYAMRSKGTILVSAKVMAPLYPAPHRACIVGHGDVANDVSRLTVNGLETTNTADQGTGAYLEHDVFFGARGGTSVFANIREYAPPTILFLQPTDSLSASHLSKLQRGYAKAVGVTL